MAIILLGALNKLHQRDKNPLTIALYLYPNYIPSMMAGLHATNPRGTNNSVAVLPSNCPSIDHIPLQPAVSIPHGMQYPVGYIYYTR